MTQILEDKLREEISEVVQRSRETSQLNKDDDLYAPVIGEELKDKALRYIELFSEELNRRFGRIMSTGPSVQPDFDGGLDFVWRDIDFTAVLNVDQKEVTYSYTTRDKKIYNGELK